MLRVVTLASRPKDNTAVATSHRTAVYLDRTESVDRLVRELVDFTRRGEVGEVCRAYVSFNAVDEEKTTKALMVYMLTNPTFQLDKVESVTASLAMKSDNLATRRWLFDCDLSDDEFGEFYDDVRTYLYRTPDTCLTAYKTRSNYSVVTSCGFDTRELMAKWGSRGVELKRTDASLFVLSARKEADGSVMLEQEPPKTFPRF